MLDGYDLSQCRYCGQLFILANEEEFDSSWFIEKFMTSAVATELFSKHHPYQWLGCHYVLEEFKSTVKCTQHSAARYPIEVMEWIGYLYPYWSLIEDIALDKMVEIAPPGVLQSSYAGMHTIAFELAINDLKEIHVEKVK